MLATRTSSSCVLCVANVLGVLARHWHVRKCLGQANRTRRDDAAARGVRGCTLGRRADERCELTHRSTLDRIGCCYPAGPCSARNLLQVTTNHYWCRPCSAQICTDEQQHACVPLLRCDIAAAQSALIRAGAALETTVTRTPHTSSHVQQWYIATLQNAAFHRIMSTCLFTAQAKVAAAGTSVPAVILLHASALQHVLQARHAMLMSVLLCAAARQAPTASAETQA